jgi:hypothetical protein
MITGEPDAAKVASPVRRGADRKRTSSLAPRLSAYPVKVADSTVLAEIGAVPDHETVLEIPKRMMPFFPEVTRE